MDKKFVITIARGYGSGGRTVGQMLSKELHIPFYDREILYMASDDSGINLGLFQKYDEEVSVGLFDSSTKQYTGDIIPPEDSKFTSKENLFNYQAKIIKSLAEKESCIIVGRCADYILKNFDLCTVQAQNKILKTLEEAPRNVVFILTCTNPSMVLSTICSRAKKIDINLLDTEIIENYLKGLKCENAELVSNMAGGSLSTALKLAKNKDAENIVNLVFELLNDLNTSGDVLKFSSKILSFKKDIHFFLNTLISILRDIAATGANVSFKNRKRELDALATRSSAEAVSQIVNVVVEIFERLEFNGNLNGLIDYLLLKILEVRFLCQK